MSTTRSQKRRNSQQEAIESVSEGFVSPVVVENSCPLDQDVSMAGPSRPKSPRIEGSLLESLRASLKEEITSVIKNLLVDSQKEMLRLPKPEKGKMLGKTPKKKQKIKLGVCTLLQNPLESLLPKITIRM